MAPGETQTIVIAEIAGGAVEGIDYLSAIDTVRFYRNIAQHFYDVSFPVSVQQSKENTFPKEFTLSQNYPNPFNPSTIIKYQIPEISLVTVKVYGVLGNEIATLVNEEKPAGSYEIELNGEGLTSGIYFYQLRAGNFVETKKMVLIK